MASWTEIIVDGPGMRGQVSEDDKRRDVDSSLASWVWAKVDAWEQHRNRRMERRWKEYWRLWRGYWHSEDRTRESERSKLIAPALAAAVDSQVAEVVSMFDRENWFDVPDDVQDEDAADMMLSRDLLRDDLETTKSIPAFREGILNAAIFGTGIWKVSPNVVTFNKLVRDEQSFALHKEPVTRALMFHEAVRPDQFAIEPGAVTIEDALGVAHHTKKPLHWAQTKAAQGSFDADVVSLLSFSSIPNAEWEVDSAEKNQLRHAQIQDLDIIEYHGKVPAGLLKINAAELIEGDPLAELLAGDQEDPGQEVDESEMVEAIVVIAEKQWVLSAKANPFIDKSRSFVAFPWEQVPNQFWGRGICERGFNPQKALDAELRAHIDSLGFSTFPMIGVDASRLGRGTKMEVKPGKVWATDGNPNEVLAPFKFNGLDQANFEHGRSMERLVGVGTGALDLDGAEQSGASQAGSVIGIQHAAQIKRAKRAAANISEQGLGPVIRMTLDRYMQFEPTRYPYDFQFKVSAGMGVMARELEATQLNQAMLSLPPELASVKLTMVQALINNLSLDNKSAIEEAIKGALTPDPAQQEAEKVAREQEMQLKQEAIREATLENDKIAAEIRETDAKTRKLIMSLELESDKVDNDSRRVALDADSNDINRDSNEIQREAQDLQRQKLHQDAGKKAT